MWELELIEFLQRLSGNAEHNFFDYVIYGITYFGDELFFILIGLILFWCVNKKFAFKFITVYLSSAALNEGLKALFKVPRPYESRTGRVKSIFEKTGGYSFPSGHSQSISNISSQLIMRYGKKQRWLLIAGPVITVLVMFSRMYLGQHYLTDVLAGCALGLITALGLSVLFDLLKDKEEYIAFVAAPLLIILCAFVQSKNIHVVGGTFTAVSIGYFIEKRFIKFDVQAKWQIQLVKVLFGLGIALGIKEGFKLFLPEDIQYLYTFLRYFLVGVWATVGAPLIFKHFPKLWNKITRRKEVAAEGADGHT